MKKYISLFSFIALLFVGTQSFAQDADVRGKSPEVIAKQSTHELSQALELNGEQQGDVFRLFVDAEQNMQVIDSNGGDITAMQRKKAEIRKHVDKQLQSILTPEQYRAYLQLKSKKE